MDKKIEIILGLWYNGFKVACRPMINNPPPFKGLDMRIPIITPMKRKGLMNQGSGL